MWQLLSPCWLSPTCFWHMRTEAMPVTLATQIWEDVLWTTSVRLPVSFPREYHLIQTTVLLIRKTPIFLAKSMPESWLFHSFTLTGLLPTKLILQSTWNYLSRSGPGSHPFPWLHCPTPGSLAEKMNHDTDLIIILYVLKVVTDLSKISPKLSHLSFP